MSLFVSFLLLAAGGILRYGVTDDLWANINEGTVGMVLLIVGGLGVLFSLVVMLIAGGATAAVRHGLRDDKRYRRS